ncbi:PREDICTED: calpain-D-like [Rhagoletis zephyria]|uniref:calpain-D-like n=1 Tax=Rhagoletis zephyria TaxID=28612 RepID=UPI0008113D09|nr:PREDICTED: calpain-D-like [Rhagoletis zephyria]
MGVSCGRHHEVDVTKSEYRKMGLLKEHAYSVLEVISTEQLRLVKLRNPWGGIVWNGAWSDRSPLWTPSLRSELVPEGSEEGIFWISFTDLCRYFEMAIVCKIQPNWFQYAYEGPFTGSNPNGWTAYELQIDSQLIEAECSQAEVTATLYQELKGNKKTPNQAIFLVLFELLNSQSSPVIGSFVSSSVCNSQGAVTLEAELKRQKRYMLGVFAFNDWHQNESQSSQPSQYVLRINSSKQLLVDCCSANSVLLGDMVTYYVKAKGKPIHRPNITTYQLNTDWAGLVSVVENRDPRLWLQVSMQTSLKPTVEPSSQTTSGYTSAEPLNYSQKVAQSLQIENHSDDLTKKAPKQKLGDEDSDRKYLASSRNALHTRDLIPPLHW